MANVSVQPRTAVIDGQTINYQRLVIEASINGQLLSLELKLNKTETVMAKMLLASTEKLETVVTSGGDVEIKKTSSDDPLDDIFDED